MVRIDPMVWQPPARVPLAGQYAPNRLLDDAEIIPVPGGGPEDCLLDDDGMLYTALHDGRLIRLDPETHAYTLIAHLPGRPLGLEWLGDGRILACAAEGGGLLAVSRDGGPVEVLAREHAGRTMRLINNATVEPDGTIWFTDSSQRHELDDNRIDLVEHRGTGRLLRRDTDGTVETVFGGMTFANGVTLAPDGGSVLVAATGDYTIHRVPLHGPAAGIPEPFVEVLPGFPDNLSTSDDGIVWVGMPSPRNPLADLLHRTPAILRHIVAALPERVQPAPASYAMALGFDGDGRCVHNLQGSGESYHYITCARAHDGWLYMGSEDEHVTSIARVRIPAT